MKGFLHAAYVIGRRDFVASVFSKSFLFFLIGPLIIIGMSAGFGSLTQSAARENIRTTIAVIAPEEDQQAIERARERLVAGIPEASIPDFRYFDPEPDVERQAQALLHSPDSRIAAVLTRGLDNPRLSGRINPDGLRHRQIQLVIDEVRREQLVSRSGVDWQPTLIPIDRVAETVGPVAAARAMSGTIGQFVVFFLTVLLSGMLLSNLLEEKSNKIIEVLAAAVPVDAIFLGKVVSMLAISLTGIAVWFTAGSSVGWRWTQAA